MRLRLETQRDGEGGDNNNEDQDEPGITKQNVEFHVDSMRVRLLHSHLNWLTGTIGVWSELLEDHRLRNVFSFERTIWTVKGAFLYLGSMLWRY